MEDVGGMEPLAIDPPPHAEASDTAASNAVHAAARGVSPVIAASLMQSPNTGVWDSAKC